MKKFNPMFVNPRVMYEGTFGGTMWYTCERGHPYSVGDCGQNVMTSTCPCGAKIGGSESSGRLARAGNNVLDVDQRMQATAELGYSPSHIKPPPPTPSRILFSFLCIGFFQNGATSGFETCFCYQIPTQKLPRIHNKDIY